MLHTNVDRQNVPTVYLAGEMDLDCADTLRTTVSEAAIGSSEVVLDFGGVEFIDSSGTGIFVRLCLDLQSQGVTLRARSVPAVVNEVFEMLKVRALVGEAAFA
jgi:stage II sporulation protein AA (anti-sigma F factor antagonist)